MPIEALEQIVFPVINGGTGASTVETARASLGLIAKPAVRDTTGILTTADTDFNTYIIIDAIPTLHVVTDSTFVGQSIVFLSKSASEIVIDNGDADHRGNTKINQYEAVNAICTSSGAGTATVWYLIGGSA